MCFCWICAWKGLCLAGAPTTEKTHAVGLHLTPRSQRPHVWLLCSWRVTRKHPEQRSSMLAARSHTQGSKS